MSSKLPTGGPRPMALNYGMEGFDFYDNYGSALEDSHRMQTKMPDLKSSVDDFLNDSIVDHDWMIDDDLQPLPSMPDIQSDLLSQGWGPKTWDREFVPVKETPEDVSELTHKAKTLYRMAHRMSATGHSLEDIQQKVLHSSPSGDKFASIFQPYWSRIKSEHGFAGNVFVRAEAFPGMFQGKWDSTLRKKCASAKYVLTSKATGRYLHFDAVSKIPWGKAITHYHRLLSANGLEVEKSLDSIRTAFLDPKNASNQKTFVVGKSRKTVSSFKDAPVAEIVSVDKAAVKKARNLESSIKRWLSAGLITDEQAQRLSSMKDADKAMEKGAKIASKARKGEYQGAVFQSVSASRVESSKTASSTEIGRNLLHWMHKGVYGEALVKQLQASYDKGTLHRNASQIDQVVNAHDRLAGSLYIVADLYLSPRGAKGCEKAAMDMKASPAKYVIACDRCAGCVHAKLGACSKYGGRKLVSDIPDKEAIMYRNEDPTPVTTTDFDMYGLEDFDMDV